MYRLADEIRRYFKCANPVPLLPQNTNTAAQTALPKRIGTGEASNYYDEAVLVIGKVAQVTTGRTFTIIDLDQPGRNHR